MWVEEGMFWKRRRRVKGGGGGGVGEKTLVRWVSESAGRETRIILIGFVRVREEEEEEEDEAFF